MNGTAASTLYHSAPIAKRTPMARSRGAEAVQAAAATAATAPAVAAPATATDLANVAGEKEGEITYSLLNTWPVLDLKGLCGVRPGSREPVRSFRVLL
eukprot:2217947-Pleurochrysis_carterae.AAC.15